MLKGKTAIVTGAAKGIGKAIALKLAMHGANVVINYRSSLASAEQVIKEIENNGGSAFAVKADISNYNEAEILIKETVKRYGTVDILVNNAGITKDALILRMKEEDFDNVINTNLKGTFNCIKHTTPIMLKHKSGKIINISSVVGIVGNTGQVNYAAAKAGIIGLTKATAKELGARGITVNAVAPGFIQSNMTDILSDKVKEDIFNTIPLKRLGSTDDVANITAFLASPEADYVTGQVINVDGGMVM